MTSRTGRDSGWHKAGGGGSEGSAILGASLLRRVASGAHPFSRNPSCSVWKMGRTIPRVPGLSRCPGRRLLPVVGRRFGRLYVLTPRETLPLPPPPPRGRRLPAPGDQSCSHGRKRWGQRGPFSTAVTEITAVRRGEGGDRVCPSETLGPREHCDLLNTYLTALEPECRQHTLPGTHQGTEPSPLLTRWLWDQARD